MGTAGGEAMTRWQPGDQSGRRLDHGRCVPWPRSSSPAAALTAAPSLCWPVTLGADDGWQMGLAEALGPGGAAVEALLTRLLGPSPAIGDLDVATLAAGTPLGPAPAPLALVPLPEGVEQCKRVDPAWWADVDACRSAPRTALLRAGREVELEAALHVAMLLATEHLAPADDDAVDERVASGAQLWLLGGAVAWALLSEEVNPFASWAELVATGLWPVGPCQGRLVVASSMRTP